MNTFLSWSSNCIRFRTVLSLINAVAREGDNFFLELYTWVFFHVILRSNTCVHSAQWMSVHICILWSPIFFVIMTWRPTCFEKVCLTFRRKCTEQPSPFFYCPIIFFSTCPIPYGLRTLCVFVGSFPQCPPFVRTLFLNLIVFADLTVLPLNCPVPFPS
jgi:hypothetical protein